MIGEGEIPADMALLFRSILAQRSPNTRIVTYARSSLQGGSVLVWLSGDRRVIRDDARIFFRRVDVTDDDDSDKDDVWNEGEPRYSDSYSDTDPEDADYVEMLKAIDQFLPAKQLAGRPIKVSVLRQFGLVENDNLDRYLNTAFGRPPEPDQDSTGEAREQRNRAQAKSAQENR